MNDATLVHVCRTADGMEIDMSKYKTDPTKCAITVVQNFVIASKSENLCSLFRAALQKVTFIVGFLMSGLNTSASTPNSAFSNRFRSALELCADKRGGSWAVDSTSPSPYDTSKHGGIHGEAHGECY